MNTRRQILLGLFFLGVIAILGYFTLFMADVKFLGNPQRRTAYFSQTNGLRLGSPVLVAGMRWGKVTDMKFDPNKEFSERIEVTFVLDQPVTFKEDVQILIKDATLLGGKELAIEPGSVEAGLWPDGQQLFGKVQGNFIQELEAFVAENREGLSDVIGDLRQVAEQLADTQGTIGRLINDVDLADKVQLTVDEIEATAANLKALSEGLAAGEGTIGKLFQEDGLYTQIQEAVVEFEGFVKEGRETLALARDPEAGGIGRLMADPEVSQRIDNLIRNAEEISAKVNEGEGTLAKLIGDDELSRELDQIVADLREFSTQLASGEGALAALTSDPELAAKVREIVDNVLMGSRGMVSPTSTVGRLLTSDELYGDLRTVLATAQGGLEEAREAAPITSFLTAIFLGF